MVSSNLSIWYFVLHNLKFSWELYLHHEAVQEIAV
jgi:hypothetical protein